jgi:hypothetical protein
LTQNENISVFFDQEKADKQNKGGANMTKHIFNPDYHDCYEYHGNTTIELTRRQGEITLLRDWLTFDSVQEAADYFNEHCSGYE